MLKNLFECGPVGHAKASAAEAETRARPVRRRLLLRSGRAAAGRSSACWAPASHALPHRLFVQLLFNYGASCAVPCL